AAAILALRASDGQATHEPRVGVDWPTSNDAGHWRQDPISQITVALGAHWGNCRPFFLLSGDQFRTPPPPAMTSPEYTAAFNEAKNFGGDGTLTGTQRTPEQTFVSTFWAYDGTPSLCAPPRLYNQVTMTIADQANLNGVQLARLLALANVAMADAGFAAWDSKYHWDFWRPIGGIREADEGTGPTGLGDGNPNTHGDVNFMPLGAPASNLTGPNFTPPFPAYPSGHATFGGALFQTLRRFFGRDDIGFTFVSDEFNGTTRANDGTIRPYMPRTFTSFSQAEEENGQSRIYLGIHWSFDKTAGIAQGRSVANYVYDHALQPPPR
ncbi:MAG: vanadium-dependent haloperoxidase, partial [Verrucomicrobiota bacterium]|nr:vanadium-dependent haloperoxidase [Verrucomicrobiota bacterium]